MFEWRDQERLIAEALDSADDGNLLSIMDKLREMRHHVYSEHNKPLAWYWILYGRGCFLREIDFSLQLDQKSLLRNMFPVRPLELPDHFAAAKLS